MLTTLELACRAIDFLQSFAQAHADAMDATLINMLGQLLMEAGRHAEAVETLMKAPVAGGSSSFPDIVAKLGVCLLQLGHIEEGVRTMQDLLAEAAPAYHDLFVMVRSKFCADTVLCV